MNLFYKTLFIVFFLSAYFSEEIIISREYVVNENIFNNKTTNDTIILDGTVYFQACDDNACIPIAQDISHEIYINDNTSNKNISITKNNIIIDTDNPLIPNWGAIQISGFDSISNGQTAYKLIFNINKGYHIFTTDTLLSPNQVGNTEIYWYDNDFISEELSYNEPYPYIKFNKLFNQKIGYHDGELHKQNQKINNVENISSMFTFFIASFLAGLAAIFTPCVFPMIPLTVSFFAPKKNNSNSSKSGPIIYGLSIILIFIILGLGFSFLLGASALNALSTSATANVIFFIIFFIFALSFFGAFELTLPNSFLNKINKKADQDGFLGIFFMAFTLVIISFSCTAPIVGSVLILSSNGQFLTPIIGMFGFSLSFALIFTLTALFPKSLDNLPKGFNLNTIKVFLGFIELAFSLKFLSKADLTNQWGILNREIYIALWITIFLLLGFYLLGKIKLYHDDDNQKIGVIRLLLAICSFSFVFAIFPGMFGAPLSWLSGYLPPPSTQEFDIMDRFDEIESQSIKEYDNFPNDIKYQNLKNFKLPFGLKGFFDYDEAIEYSKQTGKPIFLDFTGFACENCRLMEHNVWSKPHILDILKNDVIIASLFVDSKYIMDEEDWVSDKNGKLIKKLGPKNLNLQSNMFSNAAQPLYVIIDHNENILSDPIGYCNDSEFYNFLKNGIKN